MYRNYRVAALCFDVRQRALAQCESARVTRGEARPSPLPAWNCSSWRSLLRFVVAAITVLFGVHSSIVTAQISILHTFSGDTDGSGPYAPGSGLTLVGSTLFGTTLSGGIDGAGTIYSVNIDGSGYQQLHDFTGFNDGREPLTGLTLSGSTLYGTTSVGGTTNNGGTIFSLNANGTGYQILHTFPQPGQLVSPQGDVTIVGSTLFGTTFVGGTNDSGTVFSMNTDGSNYQTLHNFDSQTANNGSSPQAAVIVSGSKIYGDTILGGGGSGGTVFSMNTDGSDYQVLHAFPVAGIVATGPDSDLLLSGSTLFGVTVGDSETGGSDFGSIFALNTDGTGFHVLHTFSGPDGGEPQSGLTLVGSTFYGVVREGGAHNLGAVFSINTDGSNFHLLYSFQGGADGGLPGTGLTYSNGYLYGTTDATNATLGGGRVFALQVSEPSSFALAALAVAMIPGVWRRRPSIA